MKKKILWLFILLIAIIAVVGLVIVMNNASKTQQLNQNNNKDFGNAERINTDGSNKKTNANYERIELEDGTLYTITGKKEEADIKIETNYYDTTITDIYYNPQNYKDKKIEIEGMYLLSDPALPYTFVGRYSTNTLCPSCPAGYSVIEYQLYGNIDREFKDEVDWIKIIGTLEIGNDETSNYQDYYYLKALNLEVMNEKGETTVNN